MTDGIDRRPARRTAALATGVAVFAALVVGVGVGAGSGVVVGLVGSLSLAAGAWALDSADRQRQAGGSVTITFGAAMFVAGLALSWSGAAGWVVLALCAGVALVAVDAVVGVDREHALDTADAFGENTNAVLLGIVLTVAANLLVTSDAVPLAAGAALELATANAFVGFVTLQLLVLSVGILTTRAASILEEWLSPGAGERRDAVESMDAVGIEPRDVPTAYWLLLAVLFVGAITPQGAALFDAFFGAVLGPVLVGGVLHAILGAVAVALLGLVALGQLQRWAALWPGDDPSRSLALQAGGLLATGVAVLVTVAVALLGIGSPASVVSPGLVPVVSFVGLVALVLGGLAAALLCVGFALRARHVLADWGLVPVPGSGFAVGSALVFLAALGSVALDASTVVVVSAVGAAILTWDLGAHATSVGRQLGREAETNHSEFVHVAASGAVVGGGVVVSLVGYFLVVPAIAPARTQAGSGRAVVALALVLLAVLAFIGAIHLRERALIADT